MRRALALGAGLAVLFVALVAARFTQSPNIYSAPVDFLAGTAAAPSISTLDDTDTGIYFPAANAVGVTAGGLEVVRIHMGGLMAAVRNTYDLGLLQGAQFRHAHLSGTIHATGLRLRGSTAALPSLADSQNTTTGLAFPAANEITFSASGVEILRIHARGLMAGTQTQDIGYLEGSQFRHAHFSGTIHGAALVVPSTLSAAPAIRAQGSATTGVNFPAADQIALTVSGVEILRVHARGLMAGTPTQDIGYLEGSQFRHAHLSGTIHAAAIRVRSSLLTAPAIAEQANTTTGFSWPALSTIGVTVNGIDVLQIHAGGLMASQDNSYDLGVVSGSRFRHLHLSGSLALGGIHAMTIASNGAPASGNSERLKPPTSYVEVTCSDVDGCTLILVIGADSDGAGLSRGQVVTIVNASSNTVTISDTGGRSEISAAFVGAVDQNMTLLYNGTKWREIARALN